jgi:hypothetical protein
VPLRIDAPRNTAMDAKNCNLPFSIEFLAQGYSRDVANDSKWSVFIFVVLEKLHWFRL